MGKRYYTYAMSIRGQMSPGVLLTERQLLKFRAKRDRDVIRTNWVKVRIYPTFVARVMGQAVCTDNAATEAVQEYERALRQMYTTPPVRYLLRSDGEVIAQWFGTVKQQALKENLVGK